MSRLTMITQNLATQQTVNGRQWRRQRDGDLHILIINTTEGHVELALSGMFT